MRDSKDIANQRVALSALVYLRSIWEENADAKERVFAAAASANLTDDLKEAIRQANTPSKLMKDTERYRRKAIKNEEKDKQSWREFRDRHEQDPTLLQDVLRANTNEGFWDRYNFVKWLKERAPADNSWGVKHWRPLREGFSETVVIAARDAIIDYWPRYKPSLESEKQNPRQHSLQFDLGVSGLNFLAQRNPDWATQLGAEDAETAIRYALEERSRLPFWADQLFDAHPILAAKIIQTQIQWDFKQPDTEHPPFSVLDTFRYGDLETSERFMSLLIKELIQHEPTSVTALRYCIDRLMRASLDIVDSIGGLALDRAKKARRSHDRERAYLWLSTLLCRQPTNGVRMLKTWLKNCHADARDALFISAISALFDHDGPRYPADRIACLAFPFIGDLAKLSYTYVPVEKDRVLGRVYSPNSRDYAERARGYLLERILQTPGAESVRILEELAAAAQHDVRRDRFLVLADQRRANNVELETLSVDAFTELKRIGELHPGNRDEFFQLILDKANDIRFYLEGDDDQQKSLVRKDLDEHSVQIKLKTEFERIANNMYEAYREPEVAEQNVPDFIISSTNIVAEVAVEVKVADNGYSIRNFTDIIHDQLIGKYLRVPGRRVHGILLITYHGEKYFWLHPETRKHVRFPQLIELLRTEAAAAVASSDHLRGVAIVGIDLTDHK